MHIIFKIIILINIYNCFHYICDLSYSKQIKNLKYSTLFPYFYLYYLIHCFLFTFPILSIIHQIKQSQLINNKYKSNMFQVLTLLLNFFLPVIDPKNVSPQFQKVLSNYHYKNTTKNMIETKSQQFFQRAIIKALITNYVFQLKFSLPVYNDYKFQEIGKTKIYDISLNAHIKLSLVFLLILDAQRVQKQPSRFTNKLRNSSIMIQVDSIIKIDRSQIFRYDFLHYTIDQLLRQNVPYQDSLYLFYDPQGTNHIFLDNIISYSQQIPYLPPQKFARQTWQPLSSQKPTQIKYSANKFLLKHLPSSQIQKLLKLSIVTMDQIRVKCIANIYQNLQELLTDIFTLISWNQIFRARSANSYIYLTHLIEHIASQITRRKLHKKFNQTKVKDFQKLLTYQLKYKINTQTWPYIPDKFRQYQEINKYVPTPIQRSEDIEKRIKTKKVPIECPQGCVCYAEDDRDFCIYTLKDGWVSECPNRVNKIECNHTDQQKMKKCKNAEIKKSQPKKCRQTSTSSQQGPQIKQQDYQIEECIIWGIDLYTRNIIFYTLPENDILNCKESIDNKDNKNNFIQDALLKAINFGGVKGWDISEACKFIIQGGAKQQVREKEKTNSKIDYQENGQEKIKQKRQDIHENGGDKIKNEDKNQEINVNGDMIQDQNKSIISQKIEQQKCQNEQKHQNEEHGENGDHGDIAQLRNNNSGVTNLSGILSNNSSSSTITIGAFKFTKKQKSEIQTQASQNKELIWQFSTINKFLQLYRPHQQSSSHPQSSQHSSSNPSSSLPLFTKLDKFYAQILLKNYQYCTSNIDKQAYRIHTKGKGARCIKKQGIKHGQFIVQYYGELYQPWRWYQRQDFIKQILKKRKLKNFIPQFYNIYLQHHKDDPQGYDIMVVDPNKKGNFSSRFSHSCNPNCGTVTTISNGKYYIGMYSFRDIKYGQQLTFDYCCMTQSNYQHIHSICLCGTQKCRGNYLQLANSRTFSQLVDKNTCFLSRNSLILQALQPVTQEDIALCAEYNIKQRMLADSPDWIKKWTSKLLKFIIAQIKMYKNELIQKWTKQYPWQSPQSPQQRANLIQLYSQTSKNDLFVLRFQNLFTTVDKMKYFLNTIECKQPPLYFLTQRQILEFMVKNKQSILRQIEEIMIEQEKNNQAFLIKYFRNLMGINDQKPSKTTRRKQQPSQLPQQSKQQTLQQIKQKLFYFRLCCLCIGHMCLFIQPTKKFNSHLFADIVFFYAFTHTYFTANQYKSHVSEEIKLTLMEITGKISDARISEKIKRRYSSQFVWGQLVSWYKQTIVNPQASLSQDRRGTLSFPMIKSTIDSRYPFQKHCRSSFIKALRDKSATSWPCAPDSGCNLSFKNPFKCYGTVFFQNIHNADKFKDLPEGNLLHNILNVMNSNFQEKLKLFKVVEEKMSGISEFDQVYNILTHIETKYFSFKDSIPMEYIEQPQNKKGKKSKKQQRQAKSRDSSNQ